MSTRASSCAGSRPAKSQCDSQASQEQALARANATLGERDATDRLSWALEHLPGPAVLSSSFGIQAAVLLHMATRVHKNLPVIFVDTGYLFPETYRFVDELTARLGLNLHVYRPLVSAAWQEARSGKRWERGVEGIADYNQDNKIEPMQRALREFDARIWIAGLRRVQSESRRDTPLLQVAGERWKLHPIADWSDRDVYFYLREHGLPYHPLRNQGYVSVGDTHTTRSLHDVDSMADTRFFGLQRECGIHEIDFAAL